MIRSRSWTVGNSEKFAIALSFDNDPDVGRAASVENSATWGSLQIWVNGLNLCQHQELNHSLDKVHWYMFPVLKWFVSNWDYLFHEERLPNKNLDRDAWLTIRHTANPPPGIGDQQADKWDEHRQTWWERHSLLACREGGLFPNIFIRRFRDSIEFSWGPMSLAGQPEHYKFYAAHGYARIETQIVADQLGDMLDSATQYLCSEMPENTYFRKLRQAFEATNSGERLWNRLGLLAGFGNNGVTPSEHYKELVTRFSASQFDGGLSSFVDADCTETFVREAPQVCLMFGSVSPQITNSDLDAITNLIGASYACVKESAKLRRMVRDEPLVSALQRPWDQGYELAEAFHEALSGVYLREFPVDIEKLIKELEIHVADVSLEDTSIRAIAIAGEQFRPTIAINSNFMYQERHPRRFTLAHELCHLLHDRTRGIRLAIASGPWAPIDIEKRANAFAAMFLMPVDLVDSLIESNNLRIESIPDVWKLCEILQVSFTAAVEHLCNLGYIDDLTRDAMKQQVIESQAPITDKQS